MSRPPVSPEVSAAFAAFFSQGAGPTHDALTNIFRVTGYGKVSPNQGLGGPSKSRRVRETMTAAEMSPGMARELVDRLLAELRIAGCFKSADEEDRQRCATLRSALRKTGWDLSATGDLMALAGSPMTAAQGRPAIDEQLARLQRADEDPGLMLGTAKEMLESTAKYVLEAFGVEYGGRTDFGELWYLARDRLGIHPKDMDKGTDTGAQLAKVYGAVWTIVEQTCELRGRQGTGHGRTLPVGVTPDMALFVIREACSITEFVLRTLDRQLGRS